MWQICCRRGVGGGVLHGSKPASQSLSAALLEDFCLQTNISQEDGSSPPPRPTFLVCCPPPHVSGSALFVWDAAFPY